MPLYELTTDRLRQLNPTNLAKHAIRERQDLQRILRDQIRILDPDLMVIAEEFGHWEDSRRRIDLLAVDKDGILVVVELKRDETGGHMELQALRYSAMVSTMTWQQAVETFGRYLEARDREDDAEALLLDHLNLDAPDDESFAQDVRIVLTAADFSRELTTAVLWLNERGLDIRCVRLEPFDDDDRLLLNVQQVIPLPEAEDFQIRIREKARQERIARVQSRDTRRFDVEVGGETFEREAKRGAIYRVVMHLIKSGQTPESLAPHLGPRSLAGLFRSVPGRLDQAGFNRAASEMRQSDGKLHQSGRWYTDDQDLIHHNGATFALTRMWGGETWEEGMSNLANHFPEARIRFGPSEK